MKSVSFIVALAMLVSSSAGYAQRIESKTQAQITASACSTSKESEQKLKDTYDKITRKYDKDKVFLTALDAAQKAWLAYRDADLKALYPLEYRKSYGSIIGTCVCDQLDKITRARIAELQQWLDGAKPDNMCAGTVMKAE